MAHQKTTCSDPQKCLVVGKIENATEQIRDERLLAVRLCGDLIDAIELAASERFETIYVVVSGFGTALASALRTLVQINTACKIVLLVQMYEEPFAIELTEQGCADDYLVCPIKPEQLFVQKGSGSNGGGAVGDLVADAETLEELARLATEDELTGLKNRRYVREFLRQLIERAATEPMRMSLLLFDIDDFKHYNDQYGHAAGDDILKQAAILMRRCCRKHDVVARIGGDEFVVVFWDNPLDTGGAHKRRTAQGAHPREIYFLAERFRREMNSTELAALGREGRGVLTISGGIAGYPAEGSSVEELFNQADKGLLEAKRSGKNRIYLVGEQAGTAAERLE